MKLQLSSVATLLLLSEGLYSVMELIYHAFFMNRFFNTLSIYGLTTIMASALGLTYTTTDHALLITLLIGLRAVVRLCITLISIAYLPRLMRHINDASAPLVQPVDMYRFSFHALFMWVSTIMKSLSERNVLIPVVTIFLGPIAASTVKVANDAALFFYRTVLKTIGSSDTVLLSYASELGSHSSQHTALRQLLRNIVILCVPMALAAWLCFLYTPTSPLLIALFGIFVSSYMLELLLSPAERILEVDYAYSYLAISYIPYIIGLALVAIMLYTGSKNLIQLILLVQSARLASSIALVIAYYCFKDRQKKCVNKVTQE